MGRVLLQIEDDAYQEDLGFSLGQLGKSGSGRVRQAQVNDATKARISKSLQVHPPPSLQLSSVFGRRDPGLSCLSRQRTLQKQSMTYGGKSTVRDRSSGTSSSVAFTPLQVKEEVSSLIPRGLLLITMFICRGWRSSTHRLQRRRWLRPTRNTSLTWPSSSRSRKSQRCDLPPPPLPPPGRSHQHCRNVSAFFCPFLFAVLLKSPNSSADSHFPGVGISLWGHQVRIKAAPSRPERLE